MENMTHQIKEICRILNFLYSSKFSFRQWSKSEDQINTKRKILKLLWIAKDIMVKTFSQAEICKLSCIFVIAENVNLFF